jgi:hypothetical protein
MMYNLKLLLLNLEMCKKEFSYRSDEQTPIWNDSLLTTIELESLESQTELKNLESDTKLQNLETEIMSLNPDQLNQRMEELQFNFELSLWSGFSQTNQNMSNKFQLNNKTTYLLGFFFIFYFLEKESFDTTLEYEDAEIFLKSKFPLVTFLLLFDKDAVLKRSFDKLRTYHDKHQDTNDVFPYMM